MLQSLVTQDQTLNMSWLNYDLASDYSEIFSYTTRVMECRINLSHYYFIMTNAKNVQWAPTSYWVTLCSSILAYVRVFHMSTHPSPTNATSDDMEVRNLLLLTYWHMYMAPLQHFLLFLVFHVRKPTLWSTVLTSWLWFAGLPANCIGVTPTKFRTTVNCSSFFGCLHYANVVTSWTHTAK